MHDAAKDDLIYYEAKNDVVQSLDGVMSGNIDDRHIFVERAGKKGLIKEGQVLGHVYSMVSIETNDEEDGYEEWNSERITKEVILTENLTKSVLCVRFADLVTKWR